MLMKSKRYRLELKSWKMRLAKMKKREILTLMIGRGSAESLIRNKTMTIMIMMTMMAV